MANLDPRFICVSDLELYMVDNASGLPLSGGIVTFYSDVNRTVLKPVYQLTGTPGNYTYAPLNNPCTLSSAGTFQDALGNNIVPYYYPFTGTPEDNTGVQELYYVVVVNSGFVPQFVRQGWPQAAGSGVAPVSDNEIDNYIPNGQFLSHNNIVSLTEPPVTAYTFTVNSVSVPVYSQAIAQGGWNFIYSQSSTATFNNSFQAIPDSGGWGINSFPRYIFNFNCTGIGNAPQYRDLRIQWPDVNKFSSGNPPGSTPFTLFFDAKSNDGNSYTFNLYQVYYYGSGVSPTNYVENFIGTITIGPSQTLKSYNINGIVFPPNEGTLSGNNDDYVGLTLRGPQSGWNIGISDFLLTEGNEVFTSFPVQTNDQMLSRGVAGWMPTPAGDGSDLYLPPILTPTGMIFDHSQIGNIIAKGSTSSFTNSISTLSNELLADGSQYLASGYSPLGIPYSRLGNYYIGASASSIPLFGTGLNFATADVDSVSTTKFALMNNGQGTGLPASDAGSTGFNFFTISSDLGSTTNLFVNRYSANLLYVQANSLTMADVSTGIGFNLIRPADSGHPYTVYTLDTSSSSIAGGDYFTFTANSTSFYVWFKVNGVGADPAPGGTGILVDLPTGFSVGNAAFFLTYALYGSAGSLITALAGSSVVANSWFAFTTSNGNKYYVWYSLNGSGIDPKPAGYTLGIPIAYASTSTAIQVAAATVAALNKTYFRVPNLQGLFLRGYDPQAMWDLDATIRAASFPSPDNYGNNYGTLEYDQFLNHNHPGSTGEQSAAGGATGGCVQGNSPFTPTQTLVIAPQGGTETRPVNVNVVWAVKY